MTNKEKQERQTLQMLQKDVTRWFTQNEFNRLQELNKKAYKENIKGFNHNHTSGDWEITEDGTANFYGVLNKKDWLMRVQQNGKLTVSEQEANMRLITNAPRLLKVAEMYYDSLKGKEESIAGLVVTEVLTDIGVID